jgi:pilus assembly protein CpaB
MKAARLVILGIAVVAGGLAALLASGSDNTPPAAPAPVAQIDTVDVLVAKNDIGIGQSLKPEDLRWQTWPTAAANSIFIRRNERASAIEQVAGSIARAPLAAGEPVRENKLIKGNGGYMAAILPPGMRAISTEISPESGVGGFILPNDHVDIILSRRERDSDRGTGNEGNTSETILTDVRVLAIDQTVEEKNGQRVVVGRTATLELSPRQSEMLVMARQLGSLSLALRSLRDAGGGATSAVPDSNDKDSRGRMNMVRFGVTTSILPK